MRHVALPLLALLTACEGALPGAGRGDGSREGTADTAADTGLDTSAFVGATWAFDVADADVSEPAGVGPILAVYIEAPVMFTVTAATDTTLDLLGGVGIAGSAPATQDTCAPTFSFPTASFEAAPAFSAGPADAALEIVGAPAMTGIRLDGELAAEGSALHDLTFAATLDARGLPDALGLADADAVCTFFADFGVSCSACPADGAPYCVEFAADGITAEPAAGPLTPVASGC